MGTNYCFAIKEDVSKAEAYHRLIEKNEIPVLEEFICSGFHIGKSSAGWRFIFEINNFYKNYEEFKEFCCDHEYVFDIFDEYGRVITFDEFEKMVKEKQNLQIDDWADLHEDGTVWLDRCFS